MPFVFYKLRKNNTLMVEQRFKPLDIHHGIWVDIFPYTNGSKFAIIRRIQFFLLRILQTLRMKTVNLIEEKASFHFWLISIIPDSIIAVIDSCVVNLIILLGNKTSKNYLVFDNDTFDRVFIKKKWLDNLADYDFENAKVKGTKEYDEYLKKIYGKEYMIPKKYTHLSDYSNVIL